jgi:negative regulator of flagellin synthesis FlgM
MEINTKTPLTGIDTGLQRADLNSQAQRPQAPDRQAPASDSDRIEFSVRSQEIQQLNEQIRASADIRESKVEQVRSAIENGTYNVKAEKIADKIISGSLLDEVF